MINVWRKLPNPWRRDGSQSDLRNETAQFKSCFSDLDPELSNVNVYYNKAAGWDRTSAFPSGVV